MPEKKREFEVGDYVRHRTKPWRGKVISCIQDRGNLRVQIRISDNMKMIFLPEDLESCPSQGKVK